jgi:hypothetical protein
MNSSEVLKAKIPGMSFLRKQESNKVDYPMIMACFHRKVYSRMLTKTTAPLHNNKSLFQTNVSLLDPRYFASELLRKVPTTAVYGQVGEDSEGMWLVFTGRFIPE